MPEQASQSDRAAMACCEAISTSCIAAHTCAGISTGTAAAAVGGITTVTDMPLNSYPATTNTELLLEKQQLAKVSEQ